MKKSPTPGASLLWALNVSSFLVLVMCWSWLSLACRVEGASFVRGDVAGGGDLELTDSVRLLGFLFLGSPEELSCEDVADADDDGELELTDGIYLLNFLFAGGAAPPPPFPDPGVDPTTDDPFSCGDTADDPPEAVEGPPPLDFTVEEGTRVSELIVAEAGGIVTAVGSATMTLEIPPGALPADMEISVAVLSDRGAGPWALMALFEPDGLELEIPATLTIELSTPVPAGDALKILENSSTDPDAIVDTGLLVEVAPGGTTVILPVEHFSGLGCDLNCHSHTLRRIIQALLAQGRTRDEILDLVCERAGAGLALPGEDVGAACQVGDPGAEPPRAAGRIRASLEGSFDDLALFKCRQGHEKQLQAYLRTFYTLEPAFLDALSGADGRVVVEPTGDECLDHLAELARTAVLPPVFLFGRDFRMGGDVDSEVSFEGQPPFHDNVPHSTPIQLRRDGKVVFENGAVVGRATARAWEKAFENLPPDTFKILRVADFELSRLDEFRGFTTGKAVNMELLDLGITNTELLIGRNVEGGKEVPWSSVRIWVPQGTPAGICMDASVQPVTFPATYRGIGQFVSTQAIDWGSGGSVECESDASWEITLSDDGSVSATLRTTRQAVVTDGNTDNADVSCMDFPDREPSSLTGAYSERRFAISFGPDFPPLVGRFDAFGATASWRIERTFNRPLGRTSMFSFSHTLSLPLVD